MTHSKHSQCVLCIRGESWNGAGQLCSKGPLLYSHTLPLEVRGSRKVDNYVENRRGSLAGEEEGEGEGVVGG